MQCHIQNPIGGCLNNSLTCTFLLQFHAIACHYYFYYYCVHVEIDMRTYATKLNRFLNLLLVFYQYIILRVNEIFMSLV